MKEEERRRRRRSEARGGGARQHLLAEVALGVWQLALLLVAQLELEQQLLDVLGTLAEHLEPPAAPLARTDDVARAYRCKGVSAPP